MCRFDADEAVEHVVEHTLWLPVVRMTIPATRRANADELVTGFDLRVWHLGRQWHDTAIGTFQPEFSRLPFASTAKAPGPVAVALPFDRCATIGKTLLLDSRVVESEAVIY